MLSSVYQVTNYEGPNLVCKTAYNIAVQGTQHVQ